MRRGAIYLRPRYDAVRTIYDYASGHAKTLESDERRERRRLRREKQRTENVGRAEKMHAARLAGTIAERGDTSCLKAFAYVGCSGWFYWKWRGQFYPEKLPTGEWFSHYAKQFHTVEINASFYSWPTVANVKSWLRQPGKRPKHRPTSTPMRCLTHRSLFMREASHIEGTEIACDILTRGCGSLQRMLTGAKPLARARRKVGVSQLEILGTLDSLAR
jgi:Protein of unknown function DUF72